MEQATASRNKKITTSYLQSSLRLMTKFFLMIFVIGIIVITILGGAAALSSDKTTTTTAYAHFFGGKTVTVEDYQIVFLPSPSYH
jgi:hypothetical protein